MTNWEIFKGNTEPHDGIGDLIDPPSWRQFGVDKKKGETRAERRGRNFVVRDEEAQMVNAALCLRRPLLITGQPGTGKSTLAYAVARELKLGKVLYWPITTRTTLKDGLYSYDAIGRLQEAKQQERQNKEEIPEAERKEQLKQIEKYITLGPLGTALLPSEHPRVLLIDEIDKSDIDLPNNLLTILEEGSFEIPELVRIKAEVPQVSVRTAYTYVQDEPELPQSKITCEINNGLVSCTAFPFVIMTSNGERDFPAPFLRRCLRLTMKPPSEAELTDIVATHLSDNTAQRPEIQQLIKDFVADRKKGTLATDQLLNAIFMVAAGKIAPKDEEKLSKEDLVKRLLMDLGRNE